MLLHTEEIIPNESVTFPTIGNYKTKTEKMIEPVNCNKEKFLKIKEGQEFFIVINELAPQICPVVAINNSGLIFEYVDTGIGVNDSSKLDMIHIGNGFCFENIGFTIVGKAEILNKHTTEFTKFMRCNVKFHALTDIEKKKLENHINRYTCDFDN